MNVDSARWRPLRIIVAPFGSEGDVAPLLWLGDELSARGHHVRVAVNPLYGSLVKARGHAFLSIGEEKPLRVMLEDERTWQGLKGAKLLLDNLLASLRTCTQHFLEDTEPVDLIIGTSFAIAAHTAASAKRVPFVRVHLQPSLLRSVGDLPLMAEGAAWLGRMPRCMIRGFFRLVNLSIDGAPLREVNRLRASLQLPPVKSFYWDVCNGGDAIAALFPEWYGPHQSDWPATLRQFDFPLASTPAHRPLPGPLERFLDAGAPPIVWTHGSANLHTGEFDAAAERTCTQLGLRGVIIAAEGAESVSAGILRVRYADFNSLFPRCRAVVHHGGVGTMTKALRAGLPQLIVPRAFDQFDNAARATRLGYAKTASYRDLSRIPESLRTVLNDPLYATRARDFGRRLRAPMEIFPWLEGIART